jgi:hypothetical protein
MVPPDPSSVRKCSIEDAAPLVHDLLDLAEERLGSRERRVRVTDWTTHRFLLARRLVAAASMKVSALGRVSRCSKTNRR